MDIIKIQGNDFKSIDPYYLYGTIFNEVNQILENFDGNWFCITHENKFLTLVGEFISVNELTGETECYNYVLPNKVNVSDFENIINFFKNNNTGNVDLSYLIFSIGELEIMTLSSLTHLMCNDYFQLAVVAKEPKTKYALNSADFQIVPAAEHHKRSIINCLKKAYINGSNEKYNSDRYMDNIQKYYEPKLLTEFNSLVCETMDKQFCGHITWNFSEDGKVANILDVFIIDRFHNLGLSKLLSGYCENLIANTDVHRMESTVIASRDRNHLGIYKSLIQDGWFAKSLIFSF